MSDGWLSRFWLIIGDCTNVALLLLSVVMMQATDGGD